MKLRLKKASAEKEVAEALRKGREISAQVYVKLTDSLGNTANKQVSVRLVRG